MAALPTTVVASSSSRWIPALTLVLALGAVVGALLADGAGAGPWAWLHWVCKPAVTLIILARAVSTRSPISTRYQRWIVAGIACSLGGDVFLMLPGDWFVQGLVSFLLAHLCFLVALTADARLGVRPFALLACLGYGVLNLWALWPTLPDELHVPVIVYVTVLACMGGQAVARAWHHVAARDALASPAWLAAAGALLFMLSDTLLAWNRFRFALPWSALWVLATYYAAMWLLARSVQRVASSDEAAR